MTFPDEMHMPRLRLAAEGDMLRYFEWRNDPLVRRNSFSQREITFEEHRTWFLRQLSSSDVVLLVGEMDGQTVGQIRFDIVGPRATIGFSVAEGVRGRGFGQFLLCAGVAKLRNVRPDVQVVRGVVKPDNAASLHAFEAAGFRRVAEFSASGVQAVTYDMEING